MEDEDIPTYNGALLKKSDVDILERPCFLNDKIIGFYFSHLSSIFKSPDILLVSPPVSLFLAKSSPVDEDYRSFIEPLKISEKQLVIFTVSDAEDDDSGSHWSLLVYHRGTNTFVHHDSMEGFHRDHAKSFYDTVKGFMGCSSSNSTLASSSKHKSKKKKNQKTQAATCKAIAALAADPCCDLKEGFTPQQTNGYDCGLYVMAIARFICQWYLSKPKVKNNLWFSDIEKYVDASVELTMRSEVLTLIEDLRNDGQHTS